MNRARILKKLNEIQDEAINIILGSLKKKNTALVVMATGMGKTETAIKTIKKLHGRHLWVVGRNNLVEQTFERFIENGVHSIGMLNGPCKDFDAEVIISSVQTLSKDNILEKFQQDEFTAIWIDEAHHAAANSYKTVTEYFQGTSLIGLTATPDRPDSKNIYDQFGKAVFERTFEDAQKLGILAKHMPTTVLTSSFINGMVTASGDYSAAALDRLYMSVKRNATIVDSYKKYGRDPVLKAKMKPKGICFCINIAHARLLAQEFRNTGISAEFICANGAKQDQKERAEIEEKFRTTNNIEILCSVDLLNEGVDYPDVNITLMARPTRSAIIYQQQAGRAARIDQGRKKFFVLLDFVDNCRRKYESYTLGNMLPSGSDNIPVVTEYLDQQDPIVVEQRVEKYRDGVNEFINSARKNYDVMKIAEAKFAAHFLKGKPIPGVTDEAV